MRLPRRLGKVTGIKLTDAHNGLKAYKVSAIRKLKLQFSGYSYESELITEVAKKKISYKDAFIKKNYPNQKDEQILLKKNGLLFNKSVNKFVVIW